MCCDETFQTGVLSCQHIRTSDNMAELVVDVTGLPRCNGVTMTTKDDPDETECSSSFAETSSGNENGSGMSDTEVDSQYIDENDLSSTLDRFSSVFPLRKKKLTSHWRSFIHPLMWRCKWAELRIKEFESQAAKYCRHIAAYEQKRAAFDETVVEEFGLKSQPFTYQGQRKETLKRHKRKRVEETTDLASFLLNHNLFSYCENKKSDSDGNLTSDVFADHGLLEQNGTGSDEVDNPDIWKADEENNRFLEYIIKKIEVVHARVQEMKSQLDSLLARNLIKCYSSDNLCHLVSSDAQASSVHSPTFSACNEDMVSVGGLCTSDQLLPDYDIGDFMMHESMISSFGEPIDIPDIIESTVGLLSSADVTQYQSQVGDSCETILDNILIHNEAIEVDGQVLKDLSMELHPDAGYSGENESINPHQSALDLKTKSWTSATHEQSMLKSCLGSEINFPKNKRKRGERRANSGSWSRQCPGKPDSQ